MISERTTFNSIVDHRVDVIRKVIGFIYCVFQFYSRSSRCFSFLEEFWGDSSFNSIVDHLRCGCPWEIPWTSSFNSIVDHRYTYCGRSWVFDIFIFQFYSRSSDQWCTLSRKWIGKPFNSIVDHPLTPWESFVVRIAFFQFYSRSSCLF